jgi:cysteine desulfuration protein SufE
VITTLEKVFEAFEMMDDWEQRYEYVISLGKKLPPMPPEEKKGNEVRGCMAQVWLSKRVDPGPPLRLIFSGDSDSTIVKGLISIIFLLSSNKTPQEILSADFHGVFSKLGLDSNLMLNRRNGFYSMVERIKALAAEAAGPASAATSSA